MEKILYITFIREELVMNILKQKYAFTYNQSFDKMTYSRAFYCVLS